MSPQSRDSVNRSKNPYSDRVTKLQTRCIRSILSHRASIEKAEEAIAQISNVFINGILYAQLTSKMNHHYIKKGIRWPLTSPNEIRDRWPALVGCRLWVS